MIFIIGIIYTGFSWNITRKDKVPIIVYKLYSKNNLMYQYCAIMKNTMSNYIISYIQLNIEHEINDVFINDFKKYLEGVTVHEGSFEANEQNVNELKRLLGGEVIIK